MKKKAKEKAEIKSNASKRIQAGRSAASSKYDTPVAPTHAVPVT